MCDVLPTLNQIIPAGGHFAHVIRRGERLRIVDLEGGQGVDVRRYPSSRRNPQFNAPNLKNSLRSVGIDYLWEGEALGGRRGLPATNSHRALKSTAMQSYATHMQTEAFRESARRAARKANAAPTVLMCAELNPAGCHRSLISDYLTLNGVTVHHLIDRGKVLDHAAHPDARLLDSAIIYDPSAQIELDL